MSDGAPSDQLSINEKLVCSFGIIMGMVAFLLMFKNRLLPDRSLNLTVVLTEIQSLLDVFICVLYLFRYMSYPSITNLFLKNLVCRLFLNLALFWFFAVLRSFTNVIVCLNNFIKLLYPFLSNNNNMTIIFSLGVVIEVTIAVIYVIPYVLSVSANTGAFSAPVCNYFSMTSLIEQYDFVGFQYIYSLFHFVYLYLFPVIACTVLYKEVLDCLSETQDEARTSAYRELFKSFLLDTVLFAALYGPYCFYTISYCFTGQYEARNYFEDSRMYIFLVVVYSFLFNLFSLVFKNSYRKAGKVIISSTPMGQRFLTSTNSEFGNLRMRLTKRVDEKSGSAPVVDETSGEWN